MIDRKSITELERVDGVTDRHIGKFVVLSEDDTSPLKACARQQAASTRRGGLEDDEKQAEYAHGVLVGGATHRRSQHRGHAAVLAARMRDRARLPGHLTSRALQRRMLLGGVKA